MRPLPSSDRVPGGVHLTTPDIGAARATVLAPEPPPVRAMKLAPCTTAGWCATTDVASMETARQWRHLGRNLHRIRHPITPPVQWLTSFAPIEFSCVAYPTQV